MLTMETKFQNPTANSIQPNPASSGQNALGPASLDSTAQTGNANAADWQEEVYQKIKSMKEMYLPQLNDLYQKIASKVQQHDSLTQRLQNEQIEKLRLFKMTLERIVLFLRLNKHDIQLFHKEKLHSVERHINFFLRTDRPCSKPSSSQLQGQLPQSSMQIQQPQSLDGQTNPSMQPVQGSMSAMQQNSLTNLQHNSLSGVPTISNSQQHMINTVQTGSNVDLGQGNSLNTLQQVATGSLQQSGTNPVQAKLGSLQQNSNALQQSLPKQHEQQMLQNQQLRQQSHQRQMQQVLFHRQQLMQQQQAKKQRTALLTNHQMSQLHQTYTSTVEAPLDSTAQTGNANGADWQEEFYQKIKSMKEMYLPKLNDLYQKIASKVQQHDSLTQRLQNEQIEKLRLFKMTLERIVLFLRLNKHDIQLIHKEKLHSVERHINFFLRTDRPCSKPSSSQLQGQLPQSSMQLQQPQSLDGQTNPSTQPVQGSMSAMQQNCLTNLQHNSLSGVPTISNSQQHMINTVQTGSNVDLGQGNSLNTLQQVATGSLQQSGTNPVQAKLGSLQQNSNALQQSLPKQHEQQMLQNQQLRQQSHQRQMQQVLFHRQQLMQQQQAKKQRTALLPNHQMSQLHQTYTSTVEAPLDSTAQTGNANGADWQEEVYQKIMSIKEMHLSDLNDIYQKIASLVEQRPQQEKIEKLKMTLKRIVLFLLLNKHEIQLSHKENLLSVAKHISVFLSCKWLHKPTSSPLQGQLPQPSMHTSQARNIYARQPPTMDSAGQDVASELDRLVRLIDD